MLITLECSATLRPLHRRSSRRIDLIGGFEMLAVVHGASPNGGMFASDRVMRNRPWKGHPPDHISCLRKVRHSWPLVQWIKTHSFSGHSDGDPAQSSTTPLSVRAGRAMPFR